MKWIEFIFVVFLIITLTILQIWKVKIPERSELAVKIQVFIFIIGAIGGLIDISYRTINKPSKKQVEESKIRDAERIVDTFRAKCPELFSEEFLSPERKKEKDKYIIKSIERTKNIEPEKVLTELIKLEKEIDCKVHRNIDKLLQINKEIVIVSQANGDWDTALSSINKILEYSPNDCFAFRERAYINYKKGRIEKAEKDYSKSIEVSKTEIEKASTFISMGIFYTQIGQPSKAENHLISAYKIGQEILDSTIIAASCLNLSTLYQHTGEIDKVKSYLSEAILEFEKTEDDKNIVYAKCNLATFYLCSGKIYESKKIIKDVIKLMENHSDEMLQQYTYSFLGNFYINSGDYIEAKKNILKAIEINKKNPKFESSLALDYGNLGIVFKNQGQIYKAEEEYSKALLLNKKSKNSHGICVNLMNLGNIYVEQEKYNKAEKYFEDAMSIAIEIKRKAYIANIYSNFGVMYMEQSNWDEAESNFNRALPIYDEIEDLAGKSKVIFNLASITKERGNKEEAIELYTKSKKIFQQMGLPHMMAKVENELVKLKDDNTNDVNDSKQEFFMTMVQCRIPDGLMFSFEKIEPNKPMTVKADEKTSYICFNDGLEISIIDFVERVKQFYQTNPPKEDKDVKYANLQKNNEIVNKYEINISFPDETICKFTEGGQLWVKEAKGIIEICKKSSKFDNYEMFSMDENTIVKRGWVSENDMRIGLLLKQNIYQDGNEAQLGFQAEGGSITVNSDNKQIDELISTLNIKIKDAK